ncbi:Cation/H(+) antiporter 15 [Apostasia shenzhenica]|uniref:Cation/H(+) antiporter 15 n=1 Tax=Apostasia shenzhenica TaxID=1088818 RepID=A0A2I0B1Z7_9ASPA|nr:Cation/H(+) antiporter 15 [Apostasia shenzhenica]
MEADGFVLSAPGKVPARNLEENITVDNPLSIDWDCYGFDMIVSNGIWVGNNPMHYSLPLLLAQLLIVSLTTRAIASLLRPFRQPRVVAETLTGILLGPTVMGRLFKGYMTLLFPQRSLSILQCVANIGLLYFVFIVGLEMDMAIFRRTGRKVLSFSVAGIILPFVVSISSGHILLKILGLPPGDPALHIFLSVAFSVTAFPVLARILVELKLISSEIGRIALSSAIIIDVLAWVLLAVAIAFTGTAGGVSGPSGSGEIPPPSHLILLSGLCFVLLCIFVVRPAVAAFMRRTPPGEAMSDMDSGTLLLGVMIASLATDAIGIHSVFGAFTYGIVIPTGAHGTALIQRVEEFVTDLLLPLFFATIGFRTDFFAIYNFDDIAIGTFIFFLTAVTKVGVTILLALYFGYPLPESISLGFLMNSRGFVEFIILNVARDKDILETEAIAVMVILSLLMTATVTPVVTVAQKRLRQRVGHKRRNLQRSRPDAEVRMLACVHHGRNVPSIISLVDFSNPTQRSPVFVCAVHLVELTGRTSAMLIAHSTGDSDGSAAAGHLPLTQGSSDHIISAFEAYEQHAGGVSVQPLTVVSPYSTMHEDICFIAKDSRADIIVLPFHKLRTVDGGMEAMNTAIRTLNRNVLAHATCSVGILIDHGLAGTSSASQLPYGAGGPARRVAVLFFGGPDDREALACAWRMAENPSVALTVVRFVAYGEATADEQPHLSGPRPNHESKISLTVEVGRESWMVDEEYVSEFRLKHLGSESIVYVERAVTDSEETVAAIRGMAQERHDLYVVGRGSGASPLTAGMMDWTECGELGPIGDLLASPDFGAGSSVLVVQQCVGESSGEAAEAVPPERPWAAEQGVRQYLRSHNARRKGEFSTSWQ